MLLLNMEILFSYPEGELMGKPVPRGEFACRKWDNFSLRFFPHAH